MKNGGNLSLFFDGLNFMHNGIIISMLLIKALFSPELYLKVYLSAHAV